MNSEQGEGIYGFTNPLAERRARVGGTGKGLS